MDDFVLDDADVPAVLEVCRRLDGVPLALELAAARVDAFGVGELAARLDDRFGVLTGGRRTALPRQQTLRATIDWSYELLPESEQVILRRIAQFRGAFSIDAAVAVAIDERITVNDAIEGVANLAEKSLITTNIIGNMGHHRLLDTTRTYALEKLHKSGELEAVARVMRSTTWTSSSEPKPNGRRGRQPNCSPATVGASTMYGRRSTGPFHQAGMLRSAWH